MGPAGNYFLKALAAGVPFLALCHQTIIEWAGNGISHSTLIAFIALYLGWSDRAKLRRTRSSPALEAGMLSLVVAVLLLLAGQAGSILTLQIASCLLIVAALVP